jgi:hypothetical protein
MDDYLAQSTHAADIVRIAADGERHGQLWRARFAALLASGLVRVPVTPGSELTWQLPADPSAGSVSTATDSLLVKMLPALRTGSQVSIDVSALTHQVAETISAIATACATDLNDPALVQSRLSFSLRANHPGLASAIQMHQSGPACYRRLVVRFGYDSDFNAHMDWPMLTAASHSDPGILPVPAMASRPLSGLHSVERGQCVMPASLFEVPAETAWLVLNVDARCMGAPRMLRSQLATCLRFADNLIDNVAWPCSGLRLDAVLNRRVAINITGIGDMLLEQGRDPASSRTFTELRRWLLFVRRCFVHESVYLARRRGPFPELGVSELVATLAPHYGARNARRLVSHRSMRHRHLLALSPFSILPSSAGLSRLDRWLHLVPVIGCADTLSMSGSDPRTRLQPNSWARLLQMTGALSAGSAIHSEKITLYS